MKKFTLLIAAVLMSAVMYGQFHIGPQIGYTSSNLTTKGVDIQSSLNNNFVIGIFARIGNKVYLQPELNYLTQGNTFKFSHATIQQKVDLKAIQVPLSLGLQLLNLKVVKLHIFGGATANFIVNKNVSPAEGLNLTGDYLTADNFKNVNYQYQFGAGLDILMLTLDVKYYGGISDFTDGSLTYSGGTISSSKSNIFMVTLGWRIL
ncbi:MAG: PorT family protein [Bacteroidales bacterium]|nr:PorT family protein [Bacteroidales bacterium]